MSSFQENLKTHPYKNLKASFNSIEKFNKAASFRISASPDAPINKCEIELFKVPSRDHFNFEIKLKGSTPWDKLSFERFGLNDDFSFNGRERGFYVSDKAVTEISLSPDTKGKKYDILLGKLSELDSYKINDDEVSFFRIIISTEKEAETTLINGTSYTDKKTIYGFGLVRVIIDGVEYHMYRLKRKGNKKYCLVLESLQTVAFSTFSIDTDCIVKALSTLTGDWHGGQRYILRSNNSSFESIESVHFRTTTYSILTGHKIIDPHGFVKYMNAIGKKKMKKSTSIFSNVVFSNISSMLKHINELERCLFLILEGNNSKSPISRITSYLVALETLASSISSKYKDHFKTIKNSKLSKKVKEQLIGMLQGFKEDLTETEFSAMLKKLENVNSPSNMDKILKSFEFFGIKLSPKMKKIIKTRNVFLHGKTPFQENEVKEKYKELTIDSLRLHMLVSVLFLKFCGYSGHIKNLAGWRIYEDNKANDDFVLTEHVYHTI